MATPVVVDGRNFLDAASLREAGFAYEGIGRPDEAARTDRADPGRAEAAESRPR